MSQAKPPLNDPQDTASQTGAAAHGDDALRGPGMWPVRWRWRISLIFLAFLLIVFAILWFSREQIAGSLIDDAIAESGLEVSYEIAEIGARQQVLGNVVVGDPSAPDLTAERVVVDIGYALGTPEIARVELVNPRLYGSYRDGVFSLGTLDPLVFAESDEPAGLPGINVALVDGRAAIQSDFGDIGIKIDGAGALDDGFAGKIAATAPELSVQGCSAQGATLYGDVTTSDGELRFDGPVRLRDARCADGRIGSADIAALIALSPDFTSVDAALNFEAETLSLGEAGLAALGGSTDLTWTFGANNGPNDSVSDSSGAKSGLVLRHEWAGSRFDTSAFKLAEISLDGTLRAASDFSRADWNAQLRGGGAQIALGDNDTLASARGALEGTLLQSLLVKFERGLAQSVRGGSVAGDVTMRSNEDGASVIVPEARLRSAAGETVLAVSRLSYGSNGRISGNILTGGSDMPRINGRMEQVAGGDLALRMIMAEYRAGEDALAIPRLQVLQDRSGNVRFNGQVLADGALPGGWVKGLSVPIEGSWSSAAGLAIGRQCTQIRVAQLTYAALTLQERSTELCPADARAMVRYDDALQIAVAVDDLQLTGALSGTPTSVAAQRAVLQYPGPFVVEGLDAQIGAPDSAIRMSFAALEGDIGETITGNFTGGAAAMDVVPLDLSGISGEWSFDDGVLNLSQTDLVLTERTGPGLAAEQRFEPLIAQGATLQLADNRITASADLREPKSGGLVTNLQINHNLSDSTGRADIDVPGIRFGDALQPSDLSYLTSGVIALAQGTVRGEGLIEWTADDIESSGAFRTDGFDFAAAFGPVRDVSGEIVFTDLINLTTAPSQVVNIGSVNPGVEALGGRVVYSLTDGNKVTLEDGRWPFMGGELILRPAELIYGGKGSQHYIFELVGLDAASFVAQMEMGNLGASGKFDGTIPIVFDPLGNGFIQRGMLISRSPGGNVSYVGELTYEDLGTMGNYAFQTLRSLDYNQMSIELNGSLAGEIITNFQIDGVRQGAGTSQNFVTRELAKLPIRFKINVRSDNFYTLALIVRGIFDPRVFASAVDTDALGLEGATFRIPDPEEPSQSTAPAGELQRRDESTVQPSESEDLP